MAKFCPECGTPTVKKDLDGRLRDVCEACHYIQFANTPMSAAALVFNGETVLLVQHNRPSKVWSLPGGYLEQDETLAECVQREVKEESGVDIRPVGIIAMRELVKETRNEFYMIFLAECDDNSVTVSPNDEEIIDAQFVALDALDSIHVTPFTRRVVEGYGIYHPQPVTPFAIDGYNPIAFMFGNL